MMDDRQGQIASHLQRCLDLVLNEDLPVEEVMRLYPLEAEELGPLIEQALYLHTNSSAFDPDPQFVQVSKQRLLKRLSGVQESIQKPAAGTSRWSWLFSLGAKRALTFRFAVVMILFLCLFAGGTGVAFASQNALPGDPLYGAKIELEDLTLALTPDPSHNAQLNLQYAERRLVEIETLQKQGRFDMVAPALLNYQKHVEQATQEMTQALQQNPAQGTQIASMVQEKVASQLVMLDNLVKSSPGQTQKALVLARDNAQRDLEAAQRITGVALPLPKTETPVPPSPSSTLPEVNMPMGQPASSSSNTPTSLATETPTPRPGIVITDTVRPPGLGFPRNTLTLTPTITTTVTILEPEETQKVHPTQKPHPDHPAKPVKTPKPSKTPRDRPSK